MKIVILWRQKVNFININFPHHYIHHNIHIWSTAKICSSSIFNYQSVISANSAFVNRDMRCSQEIWSWNNNRSNCFNRCLYLGRGSGAISSPDAVWVSRMFAGTLNPGPASQRVRTGNTVHIDTHALTCPYILHWINLIVLDGVSVRYFNIIKTNQDSTEQVCKHRKAIVHVKVIDLQVGVT